MTTVKPMTITITLLGTGNPLPDPLRAGPATLVKAGGSNIVIDAGRGVLQRLMAAGVPPLAISAVLLTHLHSDHITDLNDIVTCHWFFSQTPTPLRIYGPPRTKEMVAGMMAMLQPDVEYRMNHHASLSWAPILEVVEVAPGDRFVVGDAAVIVAATDHRPVEPTVAFRIEHDGKSVVLGGDGIPCDSLDVLCQGADAYVQTVIRDEVIRMIPSERIQDVLDYHSTVGQAAETAARANVKTLVLTHFVPPLQPGAEEEWLALARAHFTGEIVLGPDLTSVAL